MGSTDVNPPNATIHISDHGTDWLWAVFAVMAASMLGMFAWSYMRPRGTRFFHNIALIILLVSTISYFSMASNLGATPIQTEFRAQGTRQIWYVRYIQYFITFPLVLVILLFPTGLALTEILTTAFFAWIVVICGLVGALVQTSYKWGFFVFGVFAFFYIWTVLLAHGPRTTFNAGAGVRSGYIRGSGFVGFITLLYPVAWAMSEGANVISPTSEMVWYGILDILLGPMFLFYFIFGIRNIDYNAFGLQSWKYSDTYYAVPAAGVAGAVGPAYGATRNVKAAGAGIVHPAVVPVTTTAPMTATVPAPGVTFAGGLAPNAAPATLSSV